MSFSEFPTEKCDSVRRSGHDESFNQQRQRTDSRYPIQRYRCSLQYRSVHPPVVQGLVRQAEFDLEHRQMIQYFPMETGRTSLWDPRPVRWSRRTEAERLTFSLETREVGG